MPEIYWRHKLYPHAKAYNSAWNKAGQFSVPKSILEDRINDPYGELERQLVYLCIVQGDVVWAARSISGMPAQNVDRVLVNCVDVSQEPFAKEILMRKLLSS